MPYYPPPSSSGSGLPTTGGTMTGTITSTIGTVTVNTPALSATQTWNDAGVTFKGIFLNVTPTANAAASRIIDLQIGGASKFSLDTDAVTRVYDLSASHYIASQAFLDSLASATFVLETNQFHAGSGVSIVWNSSGNPNVGSDDTGIKRSLAGVVEVNNGTAGTYRDILVRSAIIDGAPSTAGAGQIAIGADTRTTIGANGGASALTALPVGYIDINVAGSSYQIPYYNRGA